MADFAIYNTQVQRVTQIVLDANNAEDPAWNPPDCVQVPFERGNYETMSNQEFYDYLSQLAATLAPAATDITTP